MTTLIPQPDEDRDTGGPLRVLMVVEATLAGVGRHVLDLAEGLSAAGHIVDVAYGEQRCEAGFRARLDRIGAHEHVPMGLPTGGLRSDMAWVRQVAKRISEHEYDIVHGHASRGGAYARLARSRGATVVYTPNAYITQAPEISAVGRRVYRTIERRLARRTDLTVHVSDSESVHADDSGYRPKRTRLVPNGIPLVPLPTRGDARRELGIDPDSPVIGFVGRLTSQKAPDRLIEAFAHLVVELPRARLAIVGDGPMHSELETRARALGISGAIDWLGFQNGQQAMPAFDVFVLPSRYEGFPYVALEALWAGLPIVTSHTAGCDVLLTDPRNGRRTDIDPEPLARAIRETIETIAEGDAAHRSAVARRYSVGAMVDATLSAYRSARSADRTKR